MLPRGQLRRVFEAPEGPHTQSPGILHLARESFNRNVKTFGVLESKWDPIRKELMRRLLEEQDKVIRSYFAQKGGTRSKGEDRSDCKGREHVLGHVCVKMARADRGQVPNSGFGIGPHTLLHTLLSFSPPSFHTISLSLEFTSA